MLFGMLLQTRLEIANKLLFFSVKKMALGFIQFWLLLMRFILWGASNASRELDVI